MVEMLVVVGIIILLMGVLWPAVMKARKASRQTACAANLKQIGDLMLIYANANEDHVPFGSPQVPKGGASAEVNPNDQNQWLTLPACYPLIDGVPSAGIGPLIANGMINQENCKILYCPSDYDERLSWRLWRNKFPERGKPGLEGVDVRISYFWRPVLSNQWKHTLMSPPAVQVYWPALMTRYDDLLNKATFAECAAWPSHGSDADLRINVLKQDGSVRSVMIHRDSKYTIRKPDLPNSITKPDSNTDSGTVTANSGPGAEIMSGLWETFLDKQ